MRFHEIPRNSISSSGRSFGPVAWYLSAAICEWSCDLQSKTWQNLKQNAGLMELQFDTVEIYRVISGSTIESNVTRIIQTFSLAESKTIPDQHV